MSDTQFSGGCVCGAVQFTITGPVAAFQYCHCSRCRKASGSAHASNLFVGYHQLQFTRGADTVRRYELPHATWWCNGFCPECGSAAPWKTRSGQNWIVPAGTLDDDPGVKPSRNIYYGSRGAWYVHVHDLQTHDTYPSG
jgi:hypothetical protein